MPKDRDTSYDNEIALSWNGADPSAVFLAAQTGNITERQFINWLDAKLTDVVDRAYEEGYHLGQLYADRA